MSIDRRRRLAANAGSVTLSADVQEAEHRLVTQARLGP